MNKRNYQAELERIISQKGDKRPSLLLHACCAACSSYVLEYLNQHFDITVYFYNPNINSREEFLYRQAEVKRLIGEMPLTNPVRLIETEWDGEEFLSFVKGLELAKEGGERCFKCYELRLRKTAEVCREGGFDYFCTTLTISPLKNAEKLNQIGEEIAKEMGISFLPSDFKKKNGYKRSIELSKEYGLYRQNYCGCGFSYRESLLREKTKGAE